MNSFLIYQIVLNNNKKYLLLGKENKKSRIYLLYKKFKP